MTKQILLSLLNCSWQWMLLSGLIWFATSSLFRKNRRSNTTVHLLWLLSLLSLPILLGLNQFVPAFSIGKTVPELAQAKPIDVSGLAALTTDLPEVSSTESDTQFKNQPLADGKSLFNWETKTDLLLCVWAIGAIAMLVRFIFGLCRIYQLRRSAVMADDSYQGICRRLAQQLNINRPVTLCFSDRVVSPISFGWLSPYILIPRKLSLEQFELVAAHELAHVQRHDWLTNLFSHFVGAIFFFHPIYHLLNRELVRLRERICDDWVIRLTGARKNYAQCLLDLVRHEDRTVPLALSLNQPSQLESRIDSILKNDRQLDVQLKPRLRLITATLLLTCLPLLSMAQLVPLKTFQVSLFAQVPEQSEKAVDKTEKKVKAVIVKENDDASGDAHEWLEVRNLTDKELNLNGWTLELTTARWDTEWKLIPFNKNAKISDGGVFIKELDDASGDTYAWLKLRTTDKGMNLNGWTLDLTTTNLFTAKLVTERKVIPTLFFTKDIKIPAGGVFRVTDLKSIEKLGTIVVQSVPPHKEQGQTIEKGDASGDAHEWVELRNIVTTELDTEKRSIRFTNDVEIPPGKATTFIIKENDDTFRDAYDWIELRNPTNKELNLKGWRFNIVTTDRDTYDWIELRNPTDKELNLKGWKLDIVTTELDTEKGFILFTKDVKIPADSVLLVPYPESLKKWLNPQNLVIEIKNPAEGGETGKMLLNGNTVQFDELPVRLLNLSEERKSTLIIQPGRDVPHEQIVKVMDIAKEAGIDKIEFAMRPSENKRMESDREQMLRGKEE
ncbi:hypothetical protein F4Y93_03345 [Candidatus Poribacteria bacterium]|nr:hypothetical protein [Candidatus Poribacteria bacterium]